MRYKHKFVKGSSYSFYNNSNELESDANFPFWELNLVHSDTFIEAYDNVTTLSKDIISGSDYRWYVEEFTFPNVDTGCYRFIIKDTNASIKNKVLYISDEIEVTNSDKGLLLVNYRNAVNIMNYNYEGLPEFSNKFHVEAIRRKPTRPESTEGYTLVNGDFLRVRTSLRKSYEFVTGWFDEQEHDATHAMAIHSNLNISYNGVFNPMTKPKDSDYETPWEENYEFIQASFRLEESNRASSNKGV